MASVLPAQVDNCRQLKSGEKWRGDILLFNPSPVVIATVYGKTLEEMRKRKRLVCQVLKVALNTRYNPASRSTLIAADTAELLELLRQTIETVETPA